MIRTAMLWCGVAAGLVPAPVGGQAGAPPPTGRYAGPVPDTGRLVPRVVVASDTSLAYAIFLPPAYDTARPWPALILMDPRGRALLPLGRFRDAAARLGYVLLSSYDTRSDEPTAAEVSINAVDRLVNDALRTIAIDPSRLYLAGFSGTARVAWSIAAGAPDHVAGVIGFGGGVPPAALAALIQQRGRPVPYFGGAGRTDFNYRVEESMVAGLEALGLEHAIRYFAGPHAWAPEAVAAEALEWMETRAQARGLAPPDTARLRAGFAAATAEARQLEEAGRRYDAWRRWRRVVATYSGFDALLDLGPATEAVRRLERDRAVRRDRDRLADLREWEAKAQRRNNDVLALLEEGAPLPSLDRLVRTAGVAELERRAADGDTLTAQSAGRMSEQLLAWTAFYIPRAAVETGDHARALRSLELAHRLRPDRPGICHFFGRVPADARAASPLLAGACAEP